MQIGPSTIIACMAAILATFLWWLCNGRPTGFWPVFGMFLFGVALVLVMLVGPLIRLP